MESLQNRIKNIINESKSLREKYLKEFELSLDYVAIFTQTGEEYEFYVEETSKIGEIFKENKTGITFILNEGFETIDGNFKLLKIRKPEESKTQIGAPDYQVPDYPNLKEKLVKNKNVNITKSSDGVELIEILDNEFNVIVYIPSKPLSEEIPDFQKSNNLDELELQLTEEKGKRLQLMADFQNYQKRIQQEKSAWGALSNMALIQDLLEIYDDLELALNDEQLNIEHAKHSMKSAQDKLVAAALKAGVEKIDVKVGDEFDKEKMEAVSTIPAQENQKGKVIAVISSAYKLTNKEGILKPAKVVVGK